jgi:hypothetical protein
VDPVADPLLLRKSGSAGNQIWDLWVLFLIKKNFLNRRRSLLLYLFIRMVIKHQ